MFATNAKKSSYGPNSNAKVALEYAQLIHLQQLAFEIGTQPKVTAAVKARAVLVESMTKTFLALSQRRREMKMKPLPGSFRPGDPVRDLRRVKTWSEPKPATIAATVADQTQ